MFIYWELGALYIMISIIIAIFMNLGERKKGELSAYSVFNKGFYRLPGQLRPEDFEREIRHEFNNMYDEDENNRLPDLQMDTSEDVDEEIKSRNGSLLSRKKSSEFHNAQERLVITAIRRLKRRIEFKAS
jgi:hypothetical protein